jgi:hypothetical protein
MDVLLGNGIRTHLQQQWEYTKRWPMDKLPLRMFTLPGQRHCVHFNRLLATFQTSKESAMHAGMAKVQVSF